MSDPEPLPVDPDASPFDVAAPRLRHRTWDLLLAIAAGGAVGGAGRYLLNTTVDSALFPWSTFVENILGCFLLGALMVFLLDVWPPSRYLRPFLAVGVMGGFTTFSAYTAETRALLLDGQAQMALIYLFASVGVGLVGVWSGIVLARAATGDRVKEKP
ncbi:MAG: CrcB family protein [Candidatus Nanopelagicales bacterium]